MQIDDQFFEMRLIEIRGNILWTERENKPGWENNLRKK